MRRLLAPLRDDDPKPVAVDAGLGTGAPVGSRLSGLAALFDGRRQGAGVALHDQVDVRAHGAEPGRLPDRAIAGGWSVSARLPLRP